MSRIRSAAQSYLEKPRLIPAHLVGLPTLTLVFQDSATIDEVVSETLPGIVCKTSAQRQVPKTMARMILLKNRISHG